MSMDWELVGRYMGNFVRWFFVIFGVPGVIFIIGAALIVKYIGVNTSDELFQKHGWLVFVMGMLVAVIAGYKAAKETIDQERSIDRAYRVFARLYKRGKRLKNGSSLEQVQQWDKEVLKCVSQYAPRHLYQMDTGRYLERTNGQLDLNMLDAALKSIENLLESDFENKL
jgi:hypothetical protein